MNGFLIEARRIKVYFPMKEQWVISGKKVLRAVDGVDMRIRKGEILGLVGESGCGKSTLGRVLLNLIRPTEGDVYFKGQNITLLNDHKIRKLRKNLGIIFQDPYASLNPSMTVGQIIEEPLKVHALMSRKERKQRVCEIMEVVGMNPVFIDRYPHEFSGGQRQRIGIARALSLNPTFVVADEPVSSLDVSIQAQIVNLLLELQERFRLTYLFISHDLSVVKHISNRVAVMYLGKIVELAEKDEFYFRPLHPYTQALLSAVPIPDPEVEDRRERIILKGDVPASTQIPGGCRFNTRCWKKMDICEIEEPLFREIEEDHWVCCHLYE